MFLFLVDSSASCGGHHHHRHRHVLVLFSLPPATFTSSLLSSPLHPSYSTLGSPLSVIIARVSLYYPLFVCLLFSEECTETEGTAIRVGDDVITTNGMVVSAAQEAPDHSERISVCSCTCYTLRSGRFRRRIESSDARKARKASMLMSGAQTDADERTCKPYETEERISLAEENNITQWRDVCDRKRASI